MVSVLVPIKPALAGLSENSYLEDLTVIEGELAPQFRKTTLFYQIEVDDSVTALTITAQPEDSEAVVEITGQSGLKPGRNTVTVKVVASDGSSTHYEIGVIKAGNVASADASLRKLSIPDTTLSPSFREDVFAYLVDVAPDVSELEIIAIPNSTNAQVSIKGNRNFTVGENTIDVVVTAEDGIEKLTYTIAVIKPEKPDDSAYERYMVHRSMLARVPWLIGALLIGFLLGGTLFNIMKRKNRKDRI